MLSITSFATDMITLGASAFANVKLDDSDDDQSIGTLTSVSNGYAKQGQIYVDVAFTEDTALRLGRWVTSKALLNDNGVTPSFYRGLHFI